MRKLKRFYVLPVWLCLIFFPYGVFPQSPNDVIINEVLNGTSYKDAVELLVVKPGGVDMRGWTITDLNNSGATPSTTEGYCSFPANPFLQNVPQFTRIVLVFTKSTGSPSPIVAQDTVAAGDSTLVLFSFGADSLLNPAPAGSGVNLGSNDNLALIAGANLASDPVIDKLNYGTSTDTWTGSVWVNNIADISGGSIAYFVNDSAGSLINDNGASGKGWTGGVAETNHSLGRLNPGQFVGSKSIRIKNITRIPVTPNSAQPVLISATVGSLNSIASVQIMYSYDSFADSAVMSLVSDSTFRDTIPATPKNKKVYYYIKAIDVGNNVEISKVDSFTVTPSIVFAQIVRNPVTPDSNQSATITAKISSFNPVASVVLFYTLRSVTDSVVMTNTADTTYQGVIPAKKRNDTVTYYIKVTDNTGQSEISSTSQYIVIIPLVFVSICDIQDSNKYLNDTVSITGIVVLGDGKLTTTQRKLYVVQSGGSGIRGIQIFSMTLPTPSDSLFKGDSVIITGKIIKYGGSKGDTVTEITDPLIIQKISSNNALPPPRRVTLSQIQDMNLEGDYVKVKGTITDNYTFTSGAKATNITIDDGISTMVVRIEEAAGLYNTASTLFPKNSTFYFNGIIGSYSKVTQILIGYPDDGFDDTVGVGDFSKAALKVSPYPFNPMSGEVLKYALRYGNDSRIIVRLFDLSGRLVSTLIDEVKSAGRDETADAFTARTWNGRMKETQQLVPVGTYLMHLEVTNRKTGKSSYKTAPIVVGTKLK